MRPPAPWSLVSFRTLNALSGASPRGGDAGGDEGDGVGSHGEPTDGLVASGGTTESTASATSTMASGRHTVCLESMNHVLVRPDLSVNSPRLTECVSRCSPQLAGSARHPLT